MIDSIFSTKLDMTQVWSKQGKRYPVTRCVVQNNLIVARHELKNNPYRQAKNQTESVILEIGYGRKKFKNMTQPLKNKLQKSGFSQGVKQLRGLHLNLTDDADQPQVGAKLKMTDILSVGDVVNIQGLTKGKGFAGVMKKYGFKGGSRTHGQRDRERAPGSIGATTDPGRVWPGKKMPGRMGGVKRTIKNLVVLHLNQKKNEVWLSGPIPGAYNSTIKITKTGQTKDISLDLVASGLVDDQDVKGEDKEQKEAKQS